MTRNALISNYAELQLRELREAGRNRPDKPVDDADMCYRWLEYYLEYSTITAENRVCSGMRRPWNCDLNGMAFGTNVMRWIRAENERHALEKTGAIVLAAVLRDSKTDKLVASAKNVYAATRL